MNKIKLGIALLSIIFSINANAIEKHFDVDTAMGARSTLITGSSNLSLDPMQSYWTLHATQSSNTVILYLTKNDALTLKTLAEKSRTLIDSINSSGGCVDFKIQEKIGTIKGVKQEFGSNSLTLYVMCKNNKTSMAFSYNGLHNVHSVDLYDRSWREIVKVANNVIALYEKHVKHQSNFIVIPTILPSIWEHKWDFTIPNSPQCIADSMVTALNGNDSISFHISADSALTIDINSLWSAYKDVKLIKLKVSNSTFESTQFYDSNRTRTFTFSKDVLKNIIDSISISKKFELEILNLNNEVSKFDVIEALNHRSLLLTYTAKLYCDALKESAGKVGIMFTDAVQNTATNEYISQNSKYKKAGVVMMAVNPNKKAYKAGVRLFDVVLGVDNKPIATKELIELFGSLDAEQKLHLSILRENEFLEVIL